MTQLQNHHAFFTVLLQWKRNASWQITPNGALEKCVGTKGPICDAETFYEKLWFPWLCWWASFERFPIDRMTMWNGSIVSFWKWTFFSSTYLATLEIFGHDSQVLDARSGPFFCCQMSVQSLHPQNGTLIWAKAISWLTQPGSGCFRHASPTACSGWRATVAGGVKRGASTNTVDCPGGPLRPAWDI